MKKVFQIFVIVSKEVCIPSSDYYEKNYDWSTDDIPTIQVFSWQEFCSEDEAFKYLEDNINEINTKVDYTILPVFKKKK